MLYVSPWHRDKIAPSTQLPIRALNQGGSTRKRIPPASARPARHGWKPISASCAVPRAAIICPVRIIIKLAYRTDGPVSARKLFDSLERLQPNQRRSNRGTQNERARSG